MSGKTWGFLLTQSMVTLINGLRFLRKRSGWRFAQPILGDITEFLLKNTWYLFYSKISGFRNYPNVVSSHDFFFLNWFLFIQFRPLSPNQNLFYHHHHPLPHRSQISWLILSLLNEQMNRLVSLNNNNNNKESVFFTVLELKAEDQIDLRVGFWCGLSSQNANDHLLALGLKRLSSKQTWDSTFNFNFFFVCFQFLLRTPVLLNYDFTLII